MEASFIIYSLQPFYKNINKRLIKSPKLYFYDVGLLCYLLGLSNTSALEIHPLRGGVFENLVISELMKLNYSKHRIPNFFFYRDSTGLEIDLVYEKEGKLHFVEIKSARTFSNTFLKNLEKWQKLYTNEFGAGFIVYAGELEQLRGNFKVFPVRDMSLDF